LIIVYLLHFVQIALKELSEIGTETTNFNPAVLVLIYRIQDIFTPNQLSISFSSLFLC